MKTVILGKKNSPWRRGKIKETRSEMRTRKREQEGFERKWGEG